jgi:hypothetical protein
MQREAIKQRIHYLLEHGGTYPEKPASLYAKVIVGLLSVIVIAEAIELFHLLQ